MDTHCEVKDKLISGLFQVLPSSYIQGIIDTISRPVLLAVVSNGTSLYHKYFLDALFRNIRVGLLEKPWHKIKVRRCKRIELLKFEILLEHTNDHGILVNGSQTLHTLREAYPLLRFRNVEVEVENEIEGSQYRYNTIIKQEEDLNNLTSGDNLQAIHFDWPPDRRNFPLNLKKLSFVCLEEPHNFDASEFINKLPTRLEDLDVDCKDMHIELEHLSLLPSTLRVLRLHNCLKIQGEDKLIVDFPPLLEILEISGYVGSGECLDISHLQKLTSVTLSKHLVFHLPTQVRRLKLVSVCDLVGLDQLSELVNLESLKISTTSRILDRIVVPQNVKLLSIDNFDDSVFSLEFKANEYHPTIRLDELNRFLRVGTPFSAFEVPCVLGGLRILKMFRGTRLSKCFWNAIENLPELKELTINYYDIHSCPNQFPPKLSVLDLSRNNISEISISSPLKKLVLEGNNFNSISKRTLQLPATLCELYLNNNSINCFEKAYEFPRSLQILDLRDNKDYLIEDIFRNLPPQIVKLSASCLSNKFGRTLVEVSSKTLWHVYLEGGVEESSMKWQFNWSDCSNLQYIQIRDVELESIRLDYFPSSLQKINFTNTGIREIQGDFGSLPNLIDASFENNPLQEWLEKNEDKVPPSVAFEIERPALTTYLIDWQYNI
ncbi:predicted protein [Scheffersomyces stipitis CBS 6054]|uniref:Uncharacterized protein n=1 Tax=Scheffersomyces stipitis (strain ATCC 58785 / CBS 6054 / NBRC 10063 / NRRL Y-11545) TaxID=322104 RepID=A3LUF3_PICST|nr:predicted protein [Scheffersomyces stipitis CBS 6054]ABN66229.2 predicted protein [Scheffersomyces stipitis CBS 6054]